MKFRHLFICLFCFIVSLVNAQDILVKTNGDIVRGTILGTDYLSVKYTLDDKTQLIMGIKDIQKFVWNGETYIIKTFFGKKKAEDRFVRIIETGKVNLYAIGGNESGMAQQTQQQPRVKVRPSIGVGMGSGGLGGGLGGSISFGGGGRDYEAPSAAAVRKTFYFIERPGTGGIQEIDLKDTQRTKQLLTQKLGDDVDLSDRIKATESFNDNLLIAFVKAYNDMHK